MGPPPTTAPTPSDAALSADPRDVAEIIANAAAALVAQADGQGRMRSIVRLL